MSWHASALSVYETWRRGAYVVDPAVVGLQDAACSHCGYGEITKSVAPGQILTVDRVCTLFCLRPLFSQTSGS